VIALVLLTCTVVLLVLYVDPITAGWGNLAWKSPLAGLFATGGVLLGGPLPYRGAFLALLWACRRYRWPRGRRFAILLPFVFAVTGLGSRAAKVIVGRPRPITLHRPAVTFPSEWARHLNGQFQSFPSGDVTVAAGLATVLFILLERGGARYLLFAIPLFSAAGRIGNARHYPSDCLAGLALGILSAWAVWRLQERWIAARAARTGALEPSTRAAVSGVPEGSGDG